MRLRAKRLAAATATIMAVLALAGSASAGVAMIERVNTSCAVGSIVKGGHSYTYGTAETHDCLCVGTTYYDTTNKRSVGDGAALLHGSPKKKIKKKKN